ncbi:NUDIX hydrolase [Streptomyces ambofaciens]
MDVVDQWNGQRACTLQAALRMTNEAFAGHLGVAVRTVASWHAEPQIVPRSEIQAALDTTFERAGESVRLRFNVLSRPAPTSVQPQALTVAIAVVVRGDEVLLVCRRGSDSLTWQFPAGMVKPGSAADAVAIQETHSETGVHCAVRQHLGSRLHPITGVIANYYLCDYLAGEVSNRDPLENVDVTWVPRSSLTRFIPQDKIYSPIMAALEDA